MKALIVMLVVAGSLAAQAPVSGNFPRDLYGPVDLRDTRTVCNGPCIWGHADSETLPILFFPPAGYRVRITALRGDLVSWIKTLPGDPATPPESTAGVLVGFSTSSSSGSPRCNYCAEGCTLYIQDSVAEKQPKSRAPFNYTGLGLLLDQDNVLNLKIAAWLNTTGKPIHIEATYTIEFVFDPIPAPAVTP